MTTCHVLFRADVAVSGEMARRKFLIEGRPNSDEEESFDKVDVGNFLHIVFLPECKCE